jgi:hypothetical protein
LSGIDWRVDEAIVHAEQERRRCRRLFVTEAAHF